MCFVKTMFTFGLVRVASGNVHVIQTSAKPMLFYHGRKPALNNFQPRSFRASHQRAYAPYVLEPFSTYCVPEHVNYILLSIPKCFFQVDICQQSVTVNNCKPIFGLTLNDWVRKNKSEDVNPNLCPQLVPFDRMEEYSKQQELQQSVPTTSFQEEEVAVSSSNPERSQQTWLEQYKNVQVTTTNPSGEQKNWTLAELIDQLVQNQQQIHLQKQETNNIYDPESELLNEMSVSEPSIDNDCTLQNEPPMDNNCTLQNKPPIDNSCIVEFFTKFPEI